MSKRGYISPSQFSRIMTAGDLKKGIDYFGTGAHTYAVELAVQRMGVELPEATAPAMQWGNENEWEALRRYEEQAMATVDPCPDPIAWFDCEWVRGYPDGLVGSDGIVEVKCPWNPGNHWRNLLVPAQYETDYKDQIQGYLLITGRKWCDFISFDPRFPESRQLAVHRIERDEPFLEVLAARILAFDHYVKTIEIPY